MTFYTKELQCAVCGEINDYRILRSVSSFGGDDLDGRPADMGRSVMEMTIQICPDCGYVARHITDYYGISKCWLQTDSYQNCDRIPFWSESAKTFYRLFLISQEIGFIEESFDAILQTAWECDDARDLENALLCRSIAINLLPQMMEGLSGENADFMSLIKLDLLRRSGRFEEATNEFASVKYQNDDLNAILGFQMEKVKEKDMKRYRAEDVVAWESKA